MLADSIFEVGVIMTFTLTLCVQLFVSSTNTDRIATLTEATRRSTLPACIGLLAEYTLINYTQLLCLDTFTQTWVGVRYACARWFVCPHYWHRRQAALRIVECVYACVYYLFGKYLCMCRVDLTKDCKLQIFVQHTVGVCV